MSVHVGTSGFSYREWKGLFYPENVNAKDMLRYYATRLSGVEINNTFYRLPRVNVLETWASQVPDGFRFSIKASRRITHFKRLNPSSGDFDALSYLLETTAILGERLGVVLFQLPPDFRKDIERLKSFLGRLPQDVRATFEFRNASWFEDDVLDALRDHNVALCIADSEDALDVPIVSTADWTYMRLRRQDYAETDLQRWADTIVANRWHTAFVFFKHEEDAGGPLMAARFREIAESGA